MAARCDGDCLFLCHNCSRALRLGAVRAGTPLPLWHMYLKGVRLHIGITDARSHIPEVLELERSRKFRPSQVTTHLSAWEDAPRVLLDDSAVKVVLARPEVLKHEARAN